MSDITVTMPVLNNLPGRNGREDFQGMMPSLSAEPAPPALKVPSQGEDALASFENLIDRYVPKDLPNTRLQIEQDETTGLFIYKSVDKDSGEVLRQYPADEVLRFISYYRESEGLVVDSQA